MTREELLIVEETHFIERPGVQMLILHPVFPMPKGWEKYGWRERTERVTVIRPDGTSCEATAQINMTHLNIRDPDVGIEKRWPITVWLTDKRQEEIPIGSRILVDRAVRDAILGKIGDE